MVCVSLHAGKLCEFSASETEQSVATFIKVGSCLKLKDLHLSVCVCVPLSLALSKDVRLDQLKHFSCSGCLGQGLQGRHIDVVI